MKIDLIRSKTMRDIKFSAWDDDGRRMVRADLVMLDNGKWVDSRGFELIQSIGHIDLNGNELNEGDIVKWGHVKGYEERTPRVAIVRLEPALNFKTINLGKNNHEFHYGNFAYARCIAMAMEKIGDIYQNPDLLKAT